MSGAAVAFDVVTEARRVLEAEASAITNAASRVGDEFVRAVDLMATARLIHVSGIGKSGHIARKIAGTLTSTGQPATFLHGGEAMHGDLGIVAPDDVVVLISRSGKCPEMVALAEVLRARGSKIIAITGVLDSPMARCCGVVLDCSVGSEAGPHGLAPTSSTAVALAMGDALAMVLMGLCGFGPDHFRRTHPGGALGKTA